MSDTITRESIQEAIEKVKGFDRPKFNPFGSFMSYAGFNIVEAPVKVVPVIQVSESFEWLTGEAREKHNSKLIELLGFKEVCPIKKDSIYIMRDYNTMVVRPEVLAVLNNIGA